VIRLWAARSPVRSETPVSSRTSLGCGCAGLISDAVVVPGLNGDGCIYLSSKEHASSAGYAPKAGLFFDVCDEAPISMGAQARFDRV
jgi:hypothetical protein